VLAASENAGSINKYFFFIVLYFYFSW
jgi:hypothetical protein